MQMSHTRKTCLRKEKLTHTDPPQRRNIRQGLRRSSSSLLDMALEATGSFFCKEAGMRRTLDLARGR